MGKWSYLLTLKAEDADRLIKAARADGVSLAHWMREALKKQLENRLNSGK